MQDALFTVKNERQLRYPLLLAAPHAGRDYPAEMMANARIPALALSRLEDRYSDLLMRAAEQAGFTTIKSVRARAWADLNRAEDDMDRGMLRDIPEEAKFSISLKQRGGLGLIPRRLHPSGEIWKRPFEYADAAQRIETFHRPYHAKLAAILQAMADKFGGAILLDIHSMPPVTNFTGHRRPDFVVGDRFGGSAASRFAEMLQAHMARDGHACALNHPYAGDYILRRHGRPARNIHALQLEICRSLYLDGDMREPSDNLPQIQQMIHSAAGILAESIGNDSMLLAAE